MKKGILLMVFCFCMVIFFGNSLWAKPGKLEVEIQSGIWTVKPALTIIDDQNWQASGEKNIGIALRWKPKSSFSLGFVYQKIQGKYSYSREESEEYHPSSIFWIGDQIVDIVKTTRMEQEKISISGDMAVIDFRWEIAPSWRIHPYFTLGFGVIFHKISDVYEQSYTGIDIHGNKIILDASNDSEDLSDLPPILPVLELKFGLKIEIIKKKLAIGIEGGFMDGVVYAGTLNFRF